MLNDEALINLKSKVVCAVINNGRNMIAATRELSLRHIGCFAHTLQLVVNTAITAGKEVDCGTEIFKLSNPKPIHHSQEENHIKL